MFKKIFTIFVIAQLLLPIPTQASDKFEEGYKNTAGQIGYTEINTLKKPLPEFIGNIINAVLAAVGVIFLGLLIYGGFIWMNAQGNDAETKRAQDIIRNAILGIVVVFFAFVVTNLFLGIFFATRDTTNEITF